MAEQKTNVMRLLDQKKIAYRAHAYPHGDTAVDGVTVAGLIGRPPECVFKTLVTRGASKCIYAFVIPVCAELDLVFLFLTYFTLYNGGLGLSTSFYNSWDMEAS